MHSKTYHLKNTNNWISTRNTNTQKNVFYEVTIFLNTVDKIQDQEKKGKQPHHIYFYFNHFVNFFKLMSNNSHTFVIML